MERSRGLAELRTCGVCMCVRGWGERAGDCKFGWELGTDELR